MSLQGGMGTQVDYGFSSANAAEFRDLMGGSGPVNGALSQFVQNAEQKLKTYETMTDSKLNDFGTQHKVNSLIEAMHESSMRSVSIQLTSKIGSKVSEGFEQLVKQQ